VGHQKSIIRQAIERLDSFKGIGESRRDAKRAIREALEAHLEALEKLGKSATPKADLLASAQAWARRSASQALVP